MSALPVLGLGVLVWLAHVGWLRMALGARDLPLAWAAAPLWVLAAGVMALGRRPSAAAPHLARALLLCFYPAALVCVMALAPEATLERVHSPISMWLSTVALLAYCAGAAIGCGAPIPSTGESEPIDSSGDTRPVTRKRTRAVFAALWSLAALGLLTTAPLSPPWAEVEGSWGEGAAAGAVLSAIAASALAVTSVAVFLGSLLRKSDAEPPLRGAAMRARVVTLLLLAMLSGTAYLTLAS